MQFTQILVKVFLFLKFAEIFTALQIQFEQFPLRCSLSPVAV